MVDSVVYSKPTIVIVKWKVVYWIGKPCNYLTLFLSILLEHKLDVKYFLYFISLTNVVDMHRKRYFTHTFKQFVNALSLNVSCIGTFPSCCTGKSFLFPAQTTIFFH